MRGTVDRKLLSSAEAFDYIAMGIQDQLELRLTECLPSWYGNSCGVVQELVYVKEAWVPFRPVCFHLRHRNDGTQVIGGGGGNVGE
jgi:hypothetical protein